MGIQSLEVKQYADILT